MRYRLGVALSVILLAAVAPPAADAGRRTLACTELMAAPLPETRITLAQVNPPSPAVPEHCEIIGSISERIGVDGRPYAIRFHLRMPTDWNRRFYFQGGGGTDGNLGNALGGSALASGYAVVSTDAGHDNGVNNDPAAGGTQAFGIDPQARIDYGYRALDVVTRTAKDIVRLHYGKKPKHSYLVGCSNGGRQGMVASQRFPDHFDGIVAGAPGFDLPKAGVAEAWNEQALAPLATRVDVNGAPYLPDTFSTGDLTLLANDILAVCDALDGLADSIVDNFPACRYDPARLQCPGAKDATCLTAGQVTALKQIYGGPRNSAGDTLYATWPWDPGVANPNFGGSLRGWSIGIPAAPGQPLVNNALNLTLGAGALAMVFVTPPDVRPTSQLANYVFGFDFDVDAPRIFQTSGIYTESSMDFMTATSTDLSAFKRKGRKLIIYNGNADGVFSTNDIVGWYEALDAAMGGKARKFARLFAVPGMGHCGGGPATSQFDAFGALVEWVEKGQAPDRIVATAPAGTPWPGRTRPLCPYPEQARYTGAGDIDDAANFVCARPPHGHGHHGHGHDDDHHDRD